MKDVQSIFKMYLEVITYSNTKQSPLFSLPFPNKSGHNLIWPCQVSTAKIGTLFLYQSFKRFRFGRNDAQGKG